MREIDQRVMIQSARSTMMDSPSNDTDLLKMREQHRDFLSEQYFVATKIYADQIHDQRMFALACIKEYGVLTVRSLMLLNGAAILALLTFVGSFFTKNDHTIILIGISMVNQLKIAFYYYASGVAIAALTSGIVYMNWSSVHASYWDPSRLHTFALSKDVDAVPDRYNMFAKYSAILSIFLGFAGLGCFIAGSYYVANAFSTLGT